MIDVKLNVASGASLTWLPQETILFDRARLSRSIEADLAPDAQLFLAESIVFGRSGMGETVQEGALFDRWRVRRDGKLIYAEGVRLDGPIAQRLAASAVAKGGIAIATVLIVPGDDLATRHLHSLYDRERRRGKAGAPICDLIEPIAQFGGPLVLLPKMLCIVSISVASPTGVPVPCASITYTRIW